MKLNFDPSRFSATEITKLTQAAAIMERALNSQKFKSFVENFSYSKIYTTGFWPFRKQATATSNFFYDTDLRNHEVYTTIMNGAESLSPEIDGEADINIEIDRSKKRGVLGYTYSHSKINWIYSWFLRDGDVYEVAGNLAHEYMHKLGFEHDFARTPLRPFSVPYAVGDFVSRFVG